MREQAPPPSAGTAKWPLQHENSPEMQGGNTVIKKQRRRFDMAIFSFLILLHQGSVTGVWFQSVATDSFAPNGPLNSN
jgi:hypothetical protein